MSNDRETPLEGIKAGVRAALGLQTGDKLARELAAERARREKAEDLLRFYSQRLSYHDDGGDKARAYFAERAGEEGRR